MKKPSLAWEHVEHSSRMKPRREGRTRKEKKKKQLLQEITKIAAG